MLEVGEGAPESAAAPAAAPHRSLDPRVIKLWRATEAITSVILLTILAIAGGIVAVAAPAAWGVVLGAWVAAATGLAALAWWYPPRAHRAWAWRLDERVLEIRSGVVWRTEQLVPLPRIQHVDLKSGPIERTFGLASLVVHTAGTQDSSVLLPGLDAADAAALRDHLVAAGGDDAV